MKNFIASGFSIAVLLLVFPQAARAIAAYEAPPSIFLENSLGVSASTDYFSTNANYEPSRGAYTSLNNGNSLTHWASHLRGRYTPTTRFSFFAGTTFAQTAAITPFQTKTNSAFTEFFAGIDWLLNTDYVQLTGEVIGSLAIDTVSDLQTKPYTNDGAHYFRPGLFAQKGFKRFRLGGYMGVHVPTGPLATLFLYEATIDARLIWSLTAGAGINGYETLVPDTSTLVNRQTAAGIANVSSERFYSFNPALVEGRVWLGWRPSKQLWLRLGYAQTINGLHNAAGSSYLLSVVYNTRSFDFGGGGGSDYAPPPPRPLSPDERLRSFEPDLEATEQGIFDMDDGTAPPPKRVNPLDQTERMLEKKSKER